MFIAFGKFLYLVDDFLSKAILKDKVVDKCYFRFCTDLKSPKDTNWQGDLLVKHKVFLGKPKGKNTDELTYFEQCANLTKFVGNF